MTTKTDGGAAFPFGQISETTGQPVNGFYDPGMSLRDAMALSVRLPDDYSVKWAEVLIGEQQPHAAEPVGVQIDWWMRVEAAYRYRMADAMLAERENT